MVPDQHRPRRVYPKREAAVGPEIGFISRQEGIDLSELDRWTLIPTGVPFAARHEKDIENLVGRFHAACQLARDFDVTGRYADLEPGRAVVHRLAFEDGSMRILHPIALDELSQLEHCFSVVLRRRTCSLIVGSLAAQSQQWS